MLAGSENGLICRDDHQYSATGSHAPLAGRRSGYEDDGHGRNVLYVMLVAILRMALALPAVGGQRRGLLDGDLLSPFSRFFQRMNDFISTTPR